jgi:hypothetical protein
MVNEMIYYFHALENKYKYIYSKLNRRVEYVSYS